MRPLPKRPSPGQPVPKPAAPPPGRTPEGGPPSEFGWYESSYELMRGLDVIECEWPDTTSGAPTLE